jgi:L-rhamnose isomerase
MTHQNRGGGTADRKPVSAEVLKAYEAARTSYGRLGVDTETVLDRLGQVPLSLHCWQGDDVAGFERPDAGLSGGGLQVTGAYPGRARSAGELRQDLDRAFSCLPGRHRLNLHAMYGEFGGGPVDRDQIQPSHFEGWIRWAAKRGMALDFNATCFSHPKADSGFTLSHPEEGIRQFWIEHVRCCRRIAAFIGRSQGSPCIHNLWIPDGTKDRTADRAGYRRRLRESLDQIYAEHFPPAEMKDSLESKLFGIGSESFVAGSHEFYMGYTLTRNKMICLDTGHFHPTESVADKISALTPFTSELLLHISRGVRWDSDHVVVLDDEVLHLCEEIVRSGEMSRIHLALDFFDASMNRVGAWVLGARSLLKGLLVAFLQPLDLLRKAEEKGDIFQLLALQEELKTKPWGAVWQFHCQSSGAPLEEEAREVIAAYDEEVTRRRT